ncbi:hypothetical protein V1264_015881 [Littorina saxatilis]
MHAPALNTECRGPNRTNSDSGDQLCNETVQVQLLLTTSEVQFFEAAYECLNDSKMFNMCDELTETIRPASSPAGDMYLASPSFFSSHTPDTTCTCSMTTQNRFSAKALYLSLSSNPSADWNITCEECGYNFQYNKNPTVNEVLFQSMGQNTTYTLQIDFRPSRGLGADDNELWISFKGGSSIQLACNVPLVTTTPGPATTKSFQGTTTSGTPNITNTAPSGDTTLVPGRNDTLSTAVDPKISTENSTQLTDSESTTVVLGTTTTDTTDTTVTVETSTTSSGVTASPTGVTASPRTTTTTAAVSREAVTNTTLTATSTEVSTLSSTTNNASVEQNATSTSSITVGLTTEATSKRADNSTQVEVTTPAPPVSTDTQGTTGTTITTPPSAYTSTPPSTTTATTPPAALTTPTTTSKTSLITTEGSPDKSTTQEMLTSSPNNTTSQEMETTRSVYTQSSSSTTTEEGAEVTSPAVPGEETSTSVVDAAPSKTSGLDDMYIYIIIAVVVVVLLILVITVILAVRRRRRMMADPNTDRKQFFVPGGDSESGITGRRISLHNSETDLTTNNNDETTVSHYAKGESSSRGQGKHAGKTFPLDAESSSGQPEKMAMTTFGKPVKSSLKKNNGNGQEEVTATQGQLASQELSTDGVDGGQQVAHAGNPPGDHTFFILEPQPEVKKKRGVLFLTDKKGRDLLRDKDGNIIGFDDDDSDDVYYDIKPSKSTATHHVNEFPRRPSSHVYSEVDDDVVKENEENNDAGSSGPVAAKHADVTPGRLSFHEYSEIELPAATHSEAMKGKKTPRSSQPRTSTSMSDGACEDVDFKPDRDKDDFIIDNVAYESTDSLGPTATSAQQKSAGHVDDDTIMIDNVAYESTDSLGLNSHARQTEQKDASRGDGDGFKIDNVAYESADSLIVKPNASSGHTDEHDSIVPAQSAVGGADSQQAEASVDEDGDGYVKIKDTHEAKRASGLRTSVPAEQKGNSPEDNKSDSIKTVHHNDHKLVDNADENRTSDELLHEWSSDLDTDDTVGRKPGGKAHISNISIQRDEAKEAVDSAGGEDVSSDGKASSSRVHVEAMRTSSV